MKQSREVRALQIVLALYILFSLVLASLNQGGSPEVAERVAPWWHFYENQFKTFLIVVCGFLTYRIAKRKGRAGMRLKNFIGFTLSALMIHILLPLFTGNPELYFFAMPLPWTTIPLQAGIPSSSFAQSHQATLGLDGIGWAITFFWVYSTLIGISTVLFGRRLHCSHLCLFNGFAAEVFDPAIPLLTKVHHPLKKRTLKPLRSIRIVYLLIALFFTGFWLVVPTIGFSSTTMQTVRVLELFWYLLANLILAMAFWVVSVGRLYCHLCPLGTVLSFLSRLGRMRIESGKTHCIGCGGCDKACPLSISIKERAIHGEPIISDQCVGCGHCVDACPTGTLSYTTAFLHCIGKAH
ncbi:MAG: 4Fe-4S binding protein [Sphaerochaetaceae bacterium]|nr:4Fe-4S binding protein [Sphaerochaetaceae bacterium]